MHINVSPTPHPPRIRRVSQHELQSFFPSIRSNRVSSNSTTSIRLSQGSKASRSSLLNRQSLQRGNNSQLSRQSFEPANNRQSNQQNESESEDIKLRRKRSFRRWCTAVTISTLLILLGAIIATIILLLMKPSTSTSTSTSTSSTSSTISTSSTSSTSTSTSSTSSSTSVTTSTTSSTSTSTSTSSTSSTSTTTTSSTSTTSVTTSTTTTMTTQNPELNSLSDNNINDNTWTLFNCTYMSAISGNLTLKFTMTTSNKHDWYLDDISVKDSSSVEMLTNGDFESSPTLTGWNTGSGGTISTTQAHLSSHSFYASSSTSISQSFSAISGVIYTISYWVYFDKTSNGNDPSAALDVTMN
ncbi:unnamed protein product [Adineta steineri]|uniref:Uncharacterized protein n=1 Tax=Adineta steineri TaxID=433720 RepID=A0A814SZZ2_9BILA|nr:unnamed protein product [Adineta steineri]CAF3933433.1 unnamed protein product [Adineta steineri]